MSTAYADSDRALDLRWWSAANYLTVTQIYLKSNPLLREPLTVADIKPRLLGHWGTSPGLSMIHTLLNRLIRTTDVDCLYAAGPGHGGPALLANSYLEDTYGELYPKMTADDGGLTRFVRQFSSPGGVPSHVGAGRADPTSPTSCSPPPEAPPRWKSSPPPRCCASSFRT